jgi:hypothetical protein
MSGSSTLLYGNAPRTQRVEGEDAWGGALPRFESCGCSGGRAGCIGQSSPECCGACDEPCTSCGGFGTILQVKLTRARRGDEDDLESGFTTITLDQATEHELELAQRHEDEHWKIACGEVVTGKSFVPLEVLAAGEIPVLSAGEIPF